MANPVYQELRDMYTYCQNPDCGSTSDLEIHHIVFRSQGGKTELGNLLLLCRECHMRAHGQIVGGEPPIKIHRSNHGAAIIFDEDDEPLAEIALTPHEPTEIDGQNAYNLNQNIKTHARIFQSSGLELGRLLYQMNEGKTYEALGYTTFKEYIAAELPIGYQWASRLKQVAGQQRRLQIESESLEGIATDKLAYILPKATPETVDDLLNQARSNSFSDLTGVVKGEEPQIPDPSQPDLCPTCKSECCPKHRKYGG